MPKSHVTVIILLAQNLDESDIINSFLSSDAKDRIFPQFVCLINRKVSDRQGPSDVRQFDTHDILTISNDRYFGSCEENLYRAQDFLDLFKCWIFCVGEHDAIDWSLLCLAIEFARKHNLDVLGWNILCKQRKADGKDAALLAIAGMDDNVTSNRYVKVLLAGQVLDSGVGYPALLSLYGPIDWAAFIGSQLYSHEAFKRVMSYKFSEHVYSFVYKQLLFSVDNSVRYGFFREPVVHRISDDFAQMAAGTHSMGWLQDHRTVQGNSPTFWIANLLHLCQLEDDPMFHMLSNSLGLAQSAAAGGDIAYTRTSILMSMFSWSRNALEYKLAGRSHYFPEFSNSSLQEVRYVKAFFGRLLSGIEAYPRVYEHINKDSKLMIADFVRFVTDYFRSMSNSENLLRLALERLTAAQALLSEDHIRIFNELAFVHFLRFRRGCD